VPSPNFGHRHVTKYRANVAPEQAAGRQIGPEADWYAVGALVYEALTGHRPIEGPPLRVLQEKQWRQPVPPRRITPPVPVDLNDLCMELLTIAPRDRLRPPELFRRLSLPPPRLASSSSGEHVFVGRTQELLFLKQQFDSARSGVAQVVLISGPSGVGKSALAKQFTRALVAEEPSAVVLHGRYYERESHAFRGVDQMVDSLCRVLERMPRAERAQLLPPEAALLAQVFPAFRGLVDASPAPAGGDAKQVRARLGAAFHDLVLRLARERPVVFVVDDLQWVDSDSKQLLADILGSAAPPPVLCIMTLRTPPEDPQAYAKLWHEGTRALFGQVDHLPLPTLSSEEGSQLAARLLGDDAEPEGLATLAEEARGVPLFIDLLARHALLRGVTEISRLRLEDALEALISELEAETRLILDLVAFSCRPASVGTLMLAASLEYAEFTRRSATLRIAGLVRTTRTQSGEALEPFHDRVRESVIHPLSTAEQRNVHEKLARALEATQGRPEAVFAHYRAAGDAVRAAHFATIAAESAMESLAFARAALLLRTAIELTNAPEEQRALKVKLGHALAGAGRGPDASEAFLSAVENAPADEAFDLRRMAAEQLLRTGKLT
jgi:predicted ATPase